MIHMTYLDAEPPDEMTWGPEGITLTARGLHDGTRLARRHIEAAAFRMRLERAVRPAVPVKLLAHRAGVAEASIYAFLQGRRTPQARTIEALAAALEELEGGEATQTDR